MDDDGSRLGHRTRDESCHDYNLSHAVYGMFPSRATDTPVRRSRAPSPAQPASKRKGPTDMDTSSPLNIKLTRSTACATWLLQTKRSRLQNRQMELHQSTCLNLNMAANDSTESDLWILPDFDDWELDNDTTQREPTKGTSAWTPIVRRAASSNRERLRARLEGDGWDFVGGKYGEDEKTLQGTGTESQESVDDEFDVVVLPVAHISC